MQPSIQALLIAAVSCALLLTACPQEEPFGQGCESDADCEQGQICSDGECAVVIGNSCTDDSECSADLSCVAGYCQDLGDCEAFFQGWYVSADGVCTAGSATGCENPFDFATVEDCLDSLPDPTCPLLPETDPSTDQDAWDALPEGTRCEYGELCCCDDCVPEVVCEVLSGGDVECSSAGACIEIVCPECADDSDCAEDEVCVAGQCDFINTCDAWWEGYYVDVNGDCVYDTGSGCGNPFPYRTANECYSFSGQCPETAPVYEARPPGSAALIAEDPIAPQLECEYDTECCCGTCYPSLVCTTSRDGQWSCYATDACSIPGCPGECTFDSDCGEGSVCEHDSEGTPVCIEGCRDNDECAISEVCLDTPCFAPPCAAVCVDACDAVTCDEGYACLYGECVPEGNPELCDFDGDGFMGHYPHACPDLLPGGDCNDRDPTVYPGAADFCFDGIDSDCGDDVCIEANCGNDLSCDPATQFCSVVYAGIAFDQALPPIGQNAVCAKLPDHCDSTDVCDCLAESWEQGGDCSVGDEGLVTVSYYAP